MGSSEDSFRKTQRSEKLTLLRRVFSLVAPDFTSLVIGIVRFLLYPILGFFAVSGLEGTWATWFVALACEGTWGTWLVAWLVDFSALNCLHIASMSMVNCGLLI